MRVWKILFLVSCLSNAQADLLEDNTVEEEQVGGGAFISRLEDSAQNQKPEVDKKNSDSLIILNVSDKIPSTGGGIRFLNPDSLGSIPPFPPPEPSWWERWWKAISAWFSGS